jgi:2-polyprenyl-3-methyl-5-hydroxy-6-metoxy-1,4-benzoquinol methylase
MRWRVPGNGVFGGHVPVMRQLLPANKTGPVLDFGCGDGLLLAVAQSLGYGDLTGVDISRALLKKAAQRTSAKLHHADGLEFLKASPNGAFEAIIAFDILEHLTRPELLETSREISRTLKPGGRLIVRVPNGGSAYSGPIYWSDLTHERLFTRGAFVQLLKPLGFEHIEALEIAPVGVYGLKSGLQAALWHIFRAMTVLRIAAETGRFRGHILTINLHIKVTRRHPFRDDPGQIGAAPFPHPPIVINMCKNKLLFSGAFSNKIGQHHLLFVRRTCILLQRGKVFAADALLGRFLPRLGPPVATQAASFVLNPILELRVWFPSSASLFSGSAMPVAAHCCGVREGGRDCRQISGDLRKSICLADSPLVHIESPAHFDLHGMILTRRVAIMFGDEPPGIRFVAPYIIAAVAQFIFDEIDKISRATRSVAISHHEIRPSRRIPQFEQRSLTLSQQPRWHGMAIDQDRNTKNLQRPVDQSAQARMIGFVEFFNAFQRFPNRNAAGINFLRLADDARDCPKPAGHAQGAGVGECGQFTIEHAGVQFVRFPVEIEIGAGKPCSNEGRTKRRGTAK